MVITIEGAKLCGSSDGFLAPGMGVGSTMLIPGVAAGRLRKHVYIAGVGADTSSHPTPRGEPIHQDQNTRSVTHPPAWSKSFIDKQTPGIPDTMNRSLEGKGCKAKRAPRVYDYYDTQEEKNPI